MNAIEVSRVSLGFILGPAVGLALLGVGWCMPQVATLAVYKPLGITPYGIRKQREQTSTRTESGLESDTSTPRWVKVFGVVVVILILLVIVMLLAGGHGPGAHLSDG
jgi:hypothetical protein